MYRLILSDKANKKLSKIKDNENLKRIIIHLEYLKQNPKSYGKPLQNALAGLWSYRIGNLRVIYEIKEQELIVFVIDLGHRKNIYAI